MMERLPDFPDLPPLSWRDKTGTRAFYIDAFISHRNGDSSIELKERLEKLGLRVWHDASADISHRMVRDHIRYALCSARTVVAYICDNEPLSGWRRAECLPALSSGKKGGFERIVVVLLNEHLPVPEDLIGCTTFAAKDTDRLANYLRQANRPPLAKDAAIRAWLRPKLVVGALPSDEIAVLGKQRLDVLARSDNDDPLSWIVWAQDLIATDLGVKSSGWLDDNPDLSPSVEGPLWELYRYLGETLLRRKDVLARLAPFEIVDYVLAPLAWLQTKPECSRRARNLIAELCLGVAEHSNHAQRAAAWLVLSDSVAEKASLHDARMAMWEAVDKVSEMEDHLQGVIRSGPYEEGKKAELLLLERQSDGIQRCRLAVTKLSTS